MKCKPRTVKGKVKVTCTVKFVSTASRSRVRVRLVRGDRVIATARRSVRRGRASVRVHPRAKVRRGRYTLLITFVDSKGRARTLVQPVRMG